MGQNIGPEQKFEVQPLWNPNKFMNFGTTPFLILILGSWKVKTDGSCKAQI